MLTDPLLANNHGIFTEQPQAINAMYSLSTNIIAAEMIKKNDALNCEKRSQLGYSSNTKRKTKHGGLTHKLQVNKRNQFPRLCTH